MKMREIINIVENAALSATPLLEGVYHVWFDGGDERRAYELNSRGDLMRRLKASTTQELRGLVSDSTVVAWDSFHETHDGVIASMDEYDVEYGGEDDGQPTNQDWKALIYLYADGVAMAPRREGEQDYVLNNPNLKRLYGGTVPLRQPRVGSY